MIAYVIHAYIYLPVYCSIVILTYVKKLNFILIFKSSRPPVAVDKLCDS